MLNQSINHVSLDVEVMRIKPHFRKSKLVVPCRVKLRMVEHEAGNYERRLLQTMVVSTEAAERKNGEDRKNGRRSCEAPGLDSGSADTLEMLMVVAIVDWHRQLRKVTYTEAPW